MPPSEPAAPAITLPVEIVPLDRARRDMRGRGLFVAFRASASLPRAGSVVSMLRPGPGAP